MLQPQPITTEADTGINAFNLGQPFFAKVLAKVIIGSNNNNLLTNLEKRNWQNGNSN